MEPTPQQRTLFERIFATPTATAIRELSPDDFQWFIWYIYFRDGLYKPVYVNGPHDGQVDIELRSADPAHPELIGVVQCRTRQINNHGNPNIGVNDVAVFIQRTRPLRLGRRCFFANTDFTPDAYKQAREEHIDLYNVEGIRRFIIDIVRRESNGIRPAEAIVPLPIPVICFANNKGGVGKTTLTVNLADAFARMNKSVLVIDADPQCNTTYWLTSMTEQGQDITLQGIIENHHPIHSTVISQTAMPGVHLIPCHRGMARFIEHMTFDSERWLAQALPAFSLSNPPIDIILIDTQPDLTRLTRAALIAANHVIFPLEYDDLSRLGVGKMIEFVDEAERMHGRSIQILGAVGTKARERTTIFQKMAREINATGSAIERSKRDGLADRFILGRIRHHVAFSDIIGLHCSIFSYKPHSDAARDIQNLAERIYGRVNLDNNPN